MYKFGNLERCNIYEGTAKELEVDGLIIKELSYPILNAKFLDTGMPFNYVMMELKPGKSPHRLFLEYPNAECYVNYSVIELPSFLLNRVTFSGMTVTMHPVVDRLSPVFHRFFCC